MSNTVIYITDPETGLVVDTDEFSPREEGLLQTLRPLCKPLRPGLTRMLQVVQKDYEDWIKAVNGENYLNWLRSQECAS